MVQALPSNIGIQQVTLKVADLDKMVNFYTKTIGLKLLKQGEGRAWLAPQGTNDAILVLKELTAGEENQGTTGLYHIAFLLPTRKDLGNMLLWLLQENVQIGAADHGYSEALYLSDPENNGIEIYWDKPEEVWDIRPNGEIIGVTEELDGDSLAAEADGHWLGISEGSKIGHIHLKVADLDATETFYKNLGFGLKSNFGQQVKFFAAGQYHHHIGTNTWSGKQLPTIQENQFGLENYTFRLPTAADLEIVQANAEEAKLHFIAKDHLLALEDPSGMIIQFTY
ncbi:glyoxalase [Enterococcus faecalis]|uniref:VOC family protein n=1 Tax=Enterococcus faecalis TaxID=1351 RepID=UPI00114497FB|nr:VOC family protein [Enterococcus faecalis]GEB00285.1 glyoxalase [Enterococcus faecalis]